MYYVPLLRWWQLVMILATTNRPYLNVGCHKPPWVMTSHAFMRAHDRLRCPLRRLDLPLQFLLRFGHCPPPMARAAPPLPHHQPSFTSEAAPTTTPPLGMAIQVQILGDPWVLQPTCAGSGQLFHPWVYLNQTRVFSVAGFKSHLRITWRVSKISII
jgi:hypothetical protein